MNDFRIPYLEHAIIRTGYTNSRCNVCSAGQQIHRVHSELTDFDELVFGVVQRLLAFTTFSVFNSKPILGNRKHVITKFTSDVFFDFNEPTQSNDIPMTWNIAKPFDA